MAEIEIKPAAPVDRNGFDFANGVLLQLKNSFYAMTLKAAKQSSLLERAISDVSEGDEIVLPLDDSTDEKSLAAIIGFCEYHKDSKPEEIPQPLEGPLESYLGEADKGYVKNFLVDPAEPKKLQGLSNIMATAHYLGVDTIVNLCCAKLGSMIQGKTPEEIRDLLGMPGQPKFREDQKFRTAEEIKAFSELKAEHPENATAVKGPDADTKVNRD